jgi:Polysaccharide biosynthesis C-terminal domain
VNVATGGVAFVLVMAGFTGLDLADNILAAAVLFALAIPLAAAEGPTGAAAASATALIAVNLVRLAQVYRRVGIQPFDAAYGRLALPAAGCAAAAWAANAVTGAHPWWVVAVATTVAGAIAYAVLLPAGLPAAERASVASFTRRISNRPR